MGKKKLEVPQDVADALTGRTYAPFTADIGDGPETFASLADVQRAVYTSVSGIQFGDAWYPKMRSIHGAKVRDARARVVATVSYNSRLWEPRAKREEIVLKRGLWRSAESVCSDSPRGSAAPR